MAGQVITRTPNALKHGVFARTLFIFKDDPDKFEAIHQRLIEEWQPDGFSEEDNILTLATLYFRKQRVPFLLYCQRQKSKQQPVDPILHELLEGEVGPFLEDVGEAYKAVVREMHRPRPRHPAQHRPELDPPIQRVSDLLGLSRRMIGDTHPEWVDLWLGLSLRVSADRDYLNANVRRADFSDGREFMRALKKTVDEVLLPAARKELREQVGKPEDDWLRALEVMPPEAIDAELVAVEKIDHLIERQLARLGRIKAMKYIGLDHPRRKPERPTSRVIEHKPSSNDSIRHHA
jgi:hypothetical protein